MSTLLRLRQDTCGISSDLEALNHTEKQRGQKERRLSLDRAIIQVIQED